MKKHFSVTLIMLVAFCTAVFAQDNSYENLIDKQLKQCMDSSENYTTYGMMNCQSRAKDIWDKELNKYYKLLMQNLSEDEKGKLKASQKSWLLFRDNEMLFASTMYDNMEGTMWRPAIIQSEVNLIKQRTLELKWYYEDITAGK